MKRAAVRTFVLAATLFAAAPVFAEDACPIGDEDASKAGGYVAAVQKAVAAAPDCPASFHLFETCQLGSTQDIALSNIVRDKCEPLFLPNIKPATKKAYAEALKHCDEVAENQSGSMYQSFAAMCEAKASRDFAAKAKAHK
ncbi:hypothetical protein [Rhodoblastus sp.]|uniref:hypothetical protein n=1 Tax=Rhodoblastus sp. TaxID=1962975 RepID=UPI0035AF7EF2